MPQIELLHLAPQRVSRDAQQARGLRLVATPVVLAFAPGGRKLYRWMAAATVQQGGSQEVCAGRAVPRVGDYSVDSTELRTR